MTQPTDPRGSNEAGNRTPAANMPGARPHHDTVMLSDVPDAETMRVEPSAIDETRISSRGSNAPGSGPANSTNATNLHLSSAALSALGQRYDILDEAGHGSMGNVYKARDRETGEVIALKLLKPEIASDQQMMDRFKNELLFARKITHKNICRVYDFNRLGGVSYTSMEFVEGESLRSVLNRFGGLPLRKGIDIAQQMCSGLKEAHAQGIIHRDLKPENVMIDARGNVKIMDFGIARSMESLTRMTGAMVGTPAYMAPEQVGGKPVDYRTDIYSLGLILYEIFTGAQAFTAENAVAVALKQMREAPVPPHEIDPQIPVSIERAILKCLEKEPEKRFQSIVELEKVFVAPRASAAPFASGSTTAGRSTQDAIAMQPATTVPAPAQAPRVAAKPKPSRAKWFALAAVLLLALLAFGQWAKKAKLADKLLPPASPAAPSLPQLAFAQPAVSPVGSAAPASRPESANGDSAAQAQASLPTPTQNPPPVAPTQTTAAAPAVTPEVAGPNISPKPATNSPASTAAPSSVQQRADAAFRENPPAANSQVPAGLNPSTQQQPFGSVLRGKGPSYIWVGRFDREDRAQDASRKIQGLGLPSMVLPRTGEDGKRIFVVFTGPVTPQRLPSEIDWLKSQGFQGVREVKGLGLFQPKAGETNQNSQGNSQGSTQ
jgi:Protein kinase domain